MVVFEEFPKIARLNRECVISEKIDGTNSCILIQEDGTIQAASRTRLITPENDNYGFARWVQDNKVDLCRLGAGKHYGEWWGCGIQKRYTIKEKRFSLFNSDRWSDPEKRPSCCHVVPVIYQGMFSSTLIQQALDDLKEYGSFADSDCIRPEGIIIWHIAARTYFKVTLENDEEWKGKVNGG